MKACRSVVGTRAPKIRYYCGSESKVFWVACSVAQMNMANQYISRTLDALNIEPGNSCLKFKARQDQKAAAGKSRKSLVEFKRRRI